MSSKLSKAPLAFSFDDFVLAPNLSSIKSRKDPDVSTIIGKSGYKLPIVSAPMNTVSGARMVNALHQLGAVGVLHRGFPTLEEHLKEVEAPFYGYISVGISGNALERVERFYNFGYTKFCIDVANGHSKSCLDFIWEIKNRFPNAEIMAGNVCTYEGAYNLAKAGANSIRVGIGPGSMCKTRVVTGHGVPQLSAIEACAGIRQDGIHDVSIIADGGIRNSGDMVKALAIGADAVMIGSLLAGTDEAPGQLIKREDGTYSKLYAGMASTVGRQVGNWFERSTTSAVPEGEHVFVEHKGSVAKVIEELVGGLKVGMSYAGAMNLEQLREKAKWIRVTSAGYTEGTPHGKK